MIRVKVLSALASALLAASALPAPAGNKTWSTGSSSYGFSNYHQRHYHPSIGYTTPVTRLRGAGLFSRSVWASGGIAGASRSQLQPLATIIHVKPPSTFRSTACAYEAGVCVIRAGN